MNSLIMRRRICTPVLQEGAGHSILLPW